MSDTAVETAAPAAEQAPHAEPIGESMSGDQLDAILQKMRPMPTTGTVPTTPAAPATPPPAKTEAEQWTDAEPAAPAPVKAPEAPKPVQPSSPFDPPPSVLGEPPAAPAPPPSVEEEFGVIPEKPARGFKSKEEEANWGNVRASHEKALAEVSRLREENRKKPPVDENTAAQIADLTARNAELNAIVERSAVESHPFVRQNFDEPRRQLFSIAQKALEKVDVDPSQLGKILSLDGKARVDAMDELYGQIESPTTREKVTNAIAQIDMLEEKKAEFLQDRQGNLERLTQAEKAEHYRQMAAQEQQMAQAVDQTIDVVTNKLGFEFLRKGTEQGYDEWNKRVDNDLSIIKDLALNNKDPQRLLTAIALGVQAPHYRVAWRAAIDRAKTAEAKLAEYEGTMPNLNGSSPAEKLSSAGTIAKDDDEMAAAGILPTDSLAIQSRKLGAYLSRNGQG